MPEVSLHRRQLNHSVISGLLVLLSPAVDTSNALMQTRNWWTDAALTSEIQVFGSI